MTFRIRPWATATPSVPVTARVTLLVTDVLTGSRTSLQATTNWTVSEGADVILGQPGPGLVEGLRVGLNNPATAQSDGTRLTVCDTLNNRVLIYQPVPTSSGATPTFVVGQADLDGRGAAPLPEDQGRSMDMPEAAYSDGVRLYVADTHWNRVLIWNVCPTQNFAWPDVVLGQQDFNTLAENTGGRSASTLYEPCSVLAEAGRLFVADRQNNRVLVWNSIPTRIGQAADVVLGQGLFTSGQPNSGGIGPKTLVQPTCVWSDGGKLFVADTGNHRILVWNSIPAVRFAAAELVLGQPDFTSSAANTGLTTPTGRTLHTPTGVQTDGVRLIVTDSGNNRVLIWNSVPTTSFTSADVAIGQPDLSTRAANTTAATSRTLSLLQPAVDLITRQMATAFSDGERLFVADTSNNRVLRYDTIPTASGAAADGVLGQSDFAERSPSNPGGLSERRYAMPFGVSVEAGRLAVADQTANRVMLYDSIPEEDGASATTVLGQSDFVGREQNAGGVGASSMNQPFSVELVDGGLLVSDFYNHRMLFWSSVPSTHGAPADGLLGQPGFQFHYPNSGNYVPEYQTFVPTASSLFCPTGMTVHGDRLFVADYYNSRVLAFPWPLVSGSSASLVLGQAGFGLGLGNAGAASPRADTLCRPASVAIGANRLFVADALNHRVLIWDGVPTTSATSATWVLGQPDFSTAVRAYGGTSSYDVSSRCLAEPVGVATDGERLVVADTRDYRILIWDTLPSANFVPADRVIGQLDLTKRVIGTSGAGKFGIAFTTAVDLDGNHLWATDCNSMRVMRFDLPRLSRVRVDPGPDRRVDLGAPVTLSATARSPIAGPLTYSWEQLTVSGTPSVNLLTPGSAQSQFTPTIGGPYAFRVTVEDPGGVTGTADFHLLVNCAPTARSGGDRALNAPPQVVLDGRDSVDPDGDTLAYSWVALGGMAGLPIAGSNTPAASFPPTPGTTYVLRLTVSDGRGGVSSETCRVMVRRNPVAHIAAPAVAFGGQRITLDGSGSIDPDGGILFYEWTQTRGAAVPIFPSPASPIVSLTAPVFDTTLEFQLAVSNPNGGLTTAEVAVKVSDRVDDHADTAETVGGTDQLSTNGAPLQAVLEGVGDVDFFSFVASTGTIYQLELRTLGVPSAEVALVDWDGLQTLARGTAIGAYSSVTLPDFRPRVTGPHFVRVQAPDGLQSGSYEISIAARADSFLQPPPFSLATREVAGQLEAVVSSEGTSVPLSFLQFLVDYDATALQLVGRSPEAGASGFNIDAQQYSLPFIDTVLESQVTARPLAAGPLVTLNFRPLASGGRPLDRVHLLVVSATPPSPLARATVFRPTADAGLPATLLAVETPSGDLLLEDPVDPDLGRRPILRLDGRNSTDPNNPRRSLAYRWCLLESPGTGARLLDVTSSTPEVTLDGFGAYRLALNVSNGVLVSPTSTVDVTVLGPSRPPHASVFVSVVGTAAPPADSEIGAVPVQAGGRILLDASSSSDEDRGDRGRLTYRWAQTAGPVTKELPAEPAVELLAFPEGTYRFELTVTDPSGLRSEPAVVSLIVMEPSDTLPRLSLTALGSATSASIGDLGERPELSPVRPLVVQAGAEISVEARVEDPEFQSGRQSGLFYWSQLSGPSVRLSQTDTPPARSRVRFVTPSRGILEFECRLRVATAGGADLGLELSRRVRIQVDGPGRPLPTARVATRMVSLSKGDASRGAQESGPVPGSVLQLDGALSTPGTGSHPMELSYRWVQVSGPTVALSSPFSSVTTFVVPELDDGRPRQYAFQLFVDDAATGDLRSAPAPAVFEVAGTERTVSIPLVQGANLIGLPVDPGPNGRPSDVRQLAEMTGASLVLYEAPSAQQPGWRVYDPLLAPYSPAIAGNRAYLLLIPRVPTGPLQLTGGAWPPSAAGPLELKRGMGLVSLPGSPATSSRLHDILRALGASVLVVSEPSPGGCRFRALTGTGPFEGDRTPVEGEGLLYWRCGGGTATLNHLLQ